jgi:hypothetical protein
MCDLDLAGQAILAEHLTLFEFGVLSCSHGVWFTSIECYAAGRATRFATTTVSNVHGCIFNDIYESCAVGNINCAIANGNFWHLPVLS